MELSIQTFGRYIKSCQRKLASTSVDYLLKARKLPFVDYNVFTWKGFIVTIRIFVF